MARDIYGKNVKFTAYSYTHREAHDCIAMMDVDKVACCIACNKPLFLGETTRHKGPREDYKKGHSMIKQLAEMSGLNAYIIWYEEEKERVYRLTVRKVFPNYSNLQSCSFEQWISFLAKFQVKHFPDCKRKDIFRNKLKTLTPSQLKDYAEILDS